jgi:hypothetical protein
MVAAGSHTRVPGEALTVRLHWIRHDGPQSEIWLESWELMMGGTLRQDFWVQ